MNFFCSNLDAMGGGRRYGRMGGRRARVRGEYRFEFARGGEGVGKGGRIGLALL
jgi:hypothetical protein